MLVRCNCLDGWLRIVDTLEKIHISALICFSHALRFFLATVVFIPRLVQNDARVHLTGRLDSGHLLRLLPLSHHTFRLRGQRPRHILMLPLIYGSRYGDVLAINLAGVMISEDDTRPRTIPSRTLLGCCHDLIAVNLAGLINRGL